MREVYTARDVVDARLMKELIESRGIRAVVRGEPLSILGISIPLGRVFPSVWVEETDFERGRQLVDEFIQSLKREREREKENTEPWACPECGEELEGQFHECWSCGAGRDSNSDGRE